MRAAVATGANAPLILEDVEIPEPGPGEVLVRITACGVCYSDLNLLLGHYPFARFPVIPGHEINGVVTAVGNGVTWPEVGTAVQADHRCRGRRRLRRVRAAQGGVRHTAAGRSGSGRRRSPDVRGPDRVQRTAAGRGTRRLPCRRHRGRRHRRARRPVRRRHGRAGRRHRPLTAHRAEGNRPRPWAPTCTSPRPRPTRSTRSKPGPKVPT
ncbi:alcohol dehydrogenase catalytic domain-containing protein [Streptomyces flaveolus]|uniref:alcohol dehydrogenase catalytic domain-containing protein n=1 Tax=Streptomyces flaveolus TaxID=67297 RepID=UPI0033C98B0E